jgi:hypothetical protein
MNCFTKCQKIFAIHNQEVSTVVNALANNFYCRFEVPIELHGDQEFGVSTHARVVGAPGNKHDRDHPSTSSQIV